MEEEGGVDEMEEDGKVNEMEEEGGVGVVEEIEEGRKERGRGGCGGGDEGR